MDFSIYLMLIGGLIGLVVGGEGLIRGASKLAAAVGISPLVIGLTVVAFGTSAPELVVSIKASLAGSDNIAVANVVGSNIFNVLFILGVCALFSPLVVSSQLIRLDVPIMIVVSILTWLFALNGKLSFIEGFILFSGIVSYTAFQVIKSRKETKAVKEQFAEEFADKEAATPKSILINLAILAGGLTILVVSGSYFVDGAIALAKGLGVSDTVIGLTIVAAGTSLPEVVTSIMATLKGERDIAIGNVVGSNIFNILGILGISSMISGTGLVVSPAMLNIDIPIMIAVAAACFPIFWSGFRINRGEGFLFLLSYIVYTVYLVLTAQNHESVTQVEMILTYGFLPVVVLILVFLGYRAYGQPKEIKN